MKKNVSVTLYIFVTSDTPDLYINIIGYCIEHYNIIKVVFLSIVEDRVQKEKTKKSLATIKERVTKQLSLIQQGQYLYRDQNTGKWQEKTIELENYDKLRYTKIAEQNIDTLVIVYESLDDEISGFLKQGNCIFDVSGVLKAFLIDVYTLLLAKNVHDIYVFELRLPHRTYDDRELIHNLSFDRRDYEYVNITKSRYTDETIIKTRPQEYLDLSKINSIDHLIESISDRFARNTLAITYFVAFIVVLIWVIIPITQGGWDNIEPIISILPILPYFIDVITSIIFKKEFSLKPSFLYDSLRNYKLKSLNNQLEDHK